MQEALNNSVNRDLPPRHREPRDITINEEQLRDLIYNATTRDNRVLRNLLQEKRDYDSECDYPRELTVQDHYKFYFDYHAVATRVVEVYPLESWQVTPTIFEDDDPNVKTEFEKAWDELGASLRGQSWHKQEEGSPVWEYLKRADILSGIGSFGVILLGFDDGQPLNTPVAMLADDEEKQTSWEQSDGETSQEDQDVEGQDDEEKLTSNAMGSIDSQYNGSIFGQDKIPKLKEGTRRKLIFMRPFDESLVQVTRIETDITSPRHGQPVMYRITLIDPDFAKEHNISMDISCPEVHWTRILHLADNLTNSEAFGVPRQQPVYRHLRNLYKLYGGAPEMYWRGALNGLSFETHPQLGGDVEIDKAAFRDMIEDFRNGLQRDLQTSGMSVKSIAPTVVDPTPNIEVQITAICIKIACPKRVFMGSERGELASSQDDSAWNDRLKHRQNTYLTPRVIIPFVDRMIATGVLPKPQGKIVEDNLIEEDTEDVREESSEEIEQAATSLQEDTTEKGRKPTANTYGKGYSIAYNAFPNGKPSNSPIGKGGSVGSESTPSGDNAASPAPAAPKSRKLPEKSESYGYCVVWPDLESMTDAQKAAIALQKTQALMAFIAGNGESAMTLMDFYTKVFNLTDEEAIGVIQAVNEQIEDDERLTPDPEQARIEQMEMEGEKFDKELEAKKELAESGQGFQAAMFDKQTEVEDKRLKAQPKGKPVANFNPDQPRDSQGRFSSGGSSAEHYAVAAMGPAQASIHLAEGLEFKDFAKQMGYPVDKASQMLEGKSLQTRINLRKSEAYSQAQEQHSADVSQWQIEMERKAIGAKIEGKYGDGILSGWVTTSAGAKAVEITKLGGEKTNANVVEFNKYYRVTSPQNGPTTNLSALEKAKLILNYNPSQPRDNQGKWSSGSGGGSIAAKATDFPEGVDNLEHVKNLGGSTGATLVKDAKGNLYVRKTGTSPDHLRAEYDAEKAYQAAGVAVPDSKLYETSGGPVKLSKFIEGKTYDQLSPAERAKVDPQIQKHFAVDAALANWDVIGMTKDNILIDTQGVAHRIDVGGSLDYRAKGAKKGSAWNIEANEFESLRNSATNPNSASVFKSMTNEQLKDSAKDLFNNKAEILEALPTKYHDVVSQRITAIKNKAEALPQSQPTKTSPTASKSAQSVTAPGPNTSTANDLVHYVKSHANGPVPKYKEDHYTKMAFLNPNGIQVDPKTGKPTFVAPLLGASVKDPANAVVAAHLQSILPPGTVIKVKGVSKNAMSKAQADLGKSVTYKSQSTKATAVGLASVSGLSKMPSPTTVGVTVPKELFKKNDGHPPHDVIVKQTQEFRDNLKGGPRAAVQQWKGSAKAIRADVAEGTNKSGHAENIIKAIEQAPVYTGVVYRGFHSEYAKDQMKIIEAAGVGGTWSDPAPMGVSRSANIGADFSYGNVLLRINAKAARSIDGKSTSLAYEHECIQMPNTSYKIVGIHKDADVSHANGNYKKVQMFVELEEI